MSEPSETARRISREVVGRSHARLVAAWLPEEVAQALDAFAAEARAEEREACARMIESCCKAEKFHGHDDVCPICADHAAAIRAREKS